MSFRPTVIYSAASAPQAYLLVGLLKDQGIAARVTNDFVQAAGGDLPVGWAAAARVVVDEADAVAAREFALEFDEQTRGSVATAEVSSSEPDEVWQEWPICPECGTRRQTECTYCGSAGNDFRLADIEADERGERVLLGCSDCDDLFQPKFYRLCANCGHDFGGGLAIAEGQAADHSQRVWALLIAAGLFAAALSGYFYWLLR